MKRFTVASMFAGIGGICVGFKQAGFDIVWANEKDRATYNTCRYNLGHSWLRVFPKFCVNIAQGIKQSKTF